VRSCVSVCVRFVGASCIFSCTRGLPFRYRFHALAFALALLQSLPRFRSLSPAISLSPSPLHALFHMRSGIWPRHEHDTHFSVLFFVLICVLMGRRRCLLTCVLIRRFMCLIRRFMCLLTCVLTGRLICPLICVFVRILIGASRRIQINTHAHTRTQTHRALTSHARTYAQNTHRNHNTRTTRNPSHDARIIHNTHHTTHTTHHTTHSTHHTPHTTHYTPPHNTHHTPHTTQHTLHTTQHTPHNTQHIPHNTHHTPHNTQHTTHNTQHTPHTTRHTQHTTHNTQHTRMNNLGALDVTVPVVAEAFSKVSVLVYSLYKATIERTFENVCLQRHSQKSVP